MDAKYCDGCRNLYPPENHPDTEVRFCTLKGQRVYHRGHHPRIPRPEFCPISDEIDKIAALSEENERLRGKAEANHDWLCGCGHWNGPNLPFCGMCNRRPIDGKVG